MSWIEIRGKECQITLESRPTYCDRGHYIAKVHPVSGTELDRDLDMGDGWPRYYFDLTCALAELESWLRWRGQWVDDAAWREMSI